MSKKLIVLSTLALLSMAVSRGSFAEDKTVEESPRPVPTTTMTAQIPNDGLFAAATAAHKILITCGGSFGLALTESESGGAVFEINHKGYDEKAKYLGYDTNHFLHYKISNWQVEMAVYNYAPHPVFMKINNLPFKKWAGWGHVVTVAK